MSGELKPCPLCGGEVDWNAGGVECHHCGLRMRMPGVWTHTVRRWNHREVVRGKWVPFLPEYSDMFKCSRCGEITRVPFKATHGMPYQYCPHCGAKNMEEA